MNHTPNFIFWLHLLGGLAGGTALLIALTALAAGTARSAAARRAWWQAGFAALAMMLAAELTGAGRGFTSRTADPVKPDRRVSVRGNLPVAIAAGRESLPPATPAGATAQSPGRPAAACWWPGWLWLVGSSLLLARFLVARNLLLATRWRQHPVADPALLHRVEAIRRRLGMPSRVQLLTFGFLRSPVAFGGLRPGIGLPARFGTAFSPVQQDAMLAHELAHLAARDPLWHGFAEIVTALLWWHPLVWWARRRLHVVSEFAADEASLVVESGPAVLAESLVAMGRQLQQRPALVWLGVEGNYRSALGRRVARLLQLEGATWHPASRTTKWAAFSGAVVVAALTVAVSAWATTNDGAEPSLAATVRQALTNTNPGESAAKTNALPVVKPAMDATNLFTRMFKVDHNTVLQSLERAVPGAFMEGGAAAASTNVSARLGRALQEFLAKQGVDFSPGTGKTIFFHDRNGMLLVRATLADLDILESAVLVLNTVPPQVNVKAKFVEITAEDSRAFGLDWYLGKLPTNGAAGTRPPGGGPAATRELRGDEVDWPARQFTNAHNIRVTATLPPNLTGILTDSQFRVVLRALEQRSGVELMSAPQVTTLSGRQAQVKISTMQQVVVGGADPHTSEPIETGPVLDVVPTVLADGFTIQLVVNASVTGFLGYEPPAVDEKGTAPKPRFRLRQLKTQALVWDGQTVVLGCTSEAPANAATDSTRPVGTNGKNATVRKQLLVFITPTIIDPAGNRVHTDDEMPFARNGVPQQQTNPPAKPGSTHAAAPSGVFPGAFPAQPPPPVKTGSAH
jgi:beta-lactamase regulating signal transducer with metallopeptidase domain